MTVSKIILPERLPNEEIEALFPINSEVVYVEDKNKFLNGRVYTIKKVDRHILHFNETHYTYAYWKWKPKGMKKYVPFSKLSKEIEDLNTMGFREDRYQTPRERILSDLLSTYREIDLSIFEDEF